MALHLRLVRRWHLPESNVRERLRTCCRITHRPGTREIQLRSELVVGAEALVCIVRLRASSFVLIIQYRACTCPGEDHPGPSVSKGRGAPEIDVLEAQKNKLGPGAKVSQSAQFAPFSHDYVYDNTTQDVWWVYNEAVTQPNSYR